MKKEEKKSDKPKPHNENLSAHKKDEAEKKGFPGYPHYPASEDIYNQEKEVDLKPQDLNKVKTQQESGKRNEKGFRKDLKDEDLDVPGSKTEET